MSLDDALVALAIKFQHRCAREAETLRRLVAAGELGGAPALHLAHGLAGAGGTFGFPEVSRAARAVEFSLKAGQAPTAGQVATLLATLDACARRPVHATERMA